MTSSPNPSFVQRLQQVERLITRRQLQRAAQLLNELNKQERDDARLYWLGSRLAEAAGNPKGMLEAAKKAHTLAPEWAPASLRLAAIYAYNRDFGAAIENVATAVKLATDQGALNAELLKDAAQVCLEVQQPAQALEWLEMAFQMSPTDDTIRFGIARAFAYKGDPAKALAIYNELLLSYPDNPNLMLDRVLCFLHLNRLDDAAADCAVLLARDPNNQDYQYYAARARGETPASQPSRVIRDLFDNYAPNFDKHLVQGLSYRLPKDVAEMILHWYPNKDADVLDLGCGTGLLGVCLGPMKGVLVGVDLSKGMVEQAAQHRVYDKFHLVNVLDALHATPAAQYDIITALDMLIYVGDLQPVIPNAHRILNAKGRFIFSCEAAPQGTATFVLNLRTNRYQHSQEYVRQLLNESGFAQVELTDRVIRHEGGKPVQGFLVVAQT